MKPVKGVCNVDKIDKQGELIISKGLKIDRQIQINIEFDYDKKVGFISEFEVKNDELHFKGEIEDEVNLDGLFPAIGFIVLEQDEYNRIITKSELMCIGLTESPANPFTYIQEIGNQ